MINTTIMLIKLTDKQKQELLKIKRKNKSAIIRDRAQAILALNENLSITDTGKALSRSYKFVKNAVKLFKEGKLNEIKFDSNNRKLSKEQREKIIEMIKNETPKDLKDFKFRDQFWTFDTLKIVVKKRHNIEYKDKNSYYNLFKEAGFSFHKPKTKDFRQDPEKMKEFKGALKKSSKTTKIRLSW